jgi:hypothetical protein
VKSWRLVICAQLQDLRPCFISSPGRSLDKLVMRLDMCSGLLLRGRP